MLGYSTRYIVFEKSYITLDYIIRFGEYDTAKACEIALDIAMGLENLQFIQMVHGSLSRFVLYCVISHLSDSIVLTERVKPNYYEAVIVMQNTAKFYKTTPIPNEKDIMDLGLLIIQIFTRSIKTPQEIKSPELLHFDIVEEIFNEDPLKKADIKRIISLLGKGKNMEGKKIPLML